MKNESLLNLLVGGAIAVGFVWTQLKSIPKLEDRVAVHDTQIEVIKTDLTYIKQGVEVLVRQGRKEREDVR